MKKTFALIWMLMYFALSAGVMVNFHYCMNKLDSAQLFAKESKVCGRCGMDTEKSHGCCRDEVKVIKVDEDQRLASYIDFVIQAPALPAPVFADYIYQLIPDDGSKHDFNNHSPPLPGGQDIYLQNSVFRI